MSSDHRQGIYDPRYDGIYQRGGPAEAAVPSPLPEPLPYVPDPPGAPAPAAVIREVGDDSAPAPRPDARNPYDTWLWIVAAALLVLGSYFIWAPVLHEQAYMEHYAVGPQSTAYQGPPWFSYTVAAGPPLIFLGGATAIGQLLILSLRHTRAA